MDVRPRIPVVADHHRLERMIRGIVTPIHHSSFLMADRLCCCRRSSGRSSHSSWSQRSSTSSVFSRRTNRTSASSAHLDMPYRDLMELGAVFPNASTRRSQAFNSQLKGRVPPTTQEHEQAGRGVGASTESDEVLSEREIQKESRDSSGGH